MFYVLSRSSIFSGADLLRIMIACSNGNFIAPPAPDIEAKGDDIDGDKVAPPLNQNNLQKWGSKAWKVATHGLNVDIHDVVKTSATVGAIHENAEVFEPRVEYAFMYLQVRIFDNPTMKLNRKPKV